MGRGSPARPASARPAPRSAVPVRSRGAWSHEVRPVTTQGSRHQEAAMSLPGWAHPCSCGQVPRGYFCTDCRGFGSGFAGQAGTHTIPPRDVQRPAEEPPPLGEAAPWATDMARRSAARRGGRPYRRLQARIKRDQQVCWICGLPIDPELRSPHPFSFSLDHLVPLSMGGSLNDPTNARAAHRLCNMKRGTGRGKPRTEGDRSAKW